MIQTSLYFILKFLIKQLEMIEIFAILLRFLKFDFDMLCNLGSSLNKLQMRSYLVLRYRFSYKFYEKILTDPNLYMCFWVLLGFWFLGSNYEQETKKANPSASNSIGFGDCIFVDEEHNKSPKEDIPVPMFLEQAEAMPSETDEMVSTFLNGFSKIVLTNVQNSNWCTINC